MKYYDWDEIRKQTTCEQIADHLGLKKTGYNRYASPHSTTGKSTAIHVDGAKWYDHHGEAKEGGGPIELWAYVRNQTNFEAATHIGDWLGLTPKHESRPARKFVRSYPYVTLDGATMHETVRWEPKDFSQRRPDPDNPGKWIYDLKGITLILYRLKDWTDREYVFVVGGEKDADSMNDRLNVPATTNAMGEGNWKPHYNEQFRGKRVYILPDNDEAGRAHAVKVAVSLRETAAKVQIITLPDLPDKGDVTDWIEAGGTAEKLLEIVQGAQDIDWDTLELPDDDWLRKKALAKKANQAPLRNYRMVERVLANEDPDKAKKVREPLLMNDIVSSVYVRFCDSPFVIGESTLFDFDHGTDEIRELKNPPSLFAWLNEKSKLSVQWSGKVEGAVTKAELFEALIANGRKYQGISQAPHYPLRNDIFYLFRNLPDPSPGHSALQKFVGMWAFESEVDIVVFKAYLASMLWYHPRHPKPIFVFDSKTGRGSGKSNTATMALGVLGPGQASEKIDISPTMLDAPDAMDRLTRRLLSFDGRQKRMVLLDNLNEHGWKSPTLSSLATSTTFSGMRPYGRGEETRPNDVVFVITVNNASLDADLADRAVFIHTRKTALGGDWVNKVIAYQDRHWLQMCADLMDIMAKGTAHWPQDGQPIPTSTRFPSWEIEVLRPFCASPEQYFDIIKDESGRKEEANSESEDAETLCRLVAQRLLNENIDIEEETVYVGTTLIHEWVRDDIDGFGGDRGYAVRRQIEDWIRQGYIANMRTTPKVYPHNGRYRINGIAIGKRILGVKNRSISFDKVVRKRSNGSIHIFKPSVEAGDLGL